VPNGTSELSRPPSSDARAALDNAAPDADKEGMRQIPISLKLVAVLSLLAEATAAALVFWHTGPRAR
jgi:hypothetical protein